MGSNDQYALNWSNHTTHIRKAFDSLFSGNEFVDVTLSCEGRKIGAHKILLSACSTYFHDLFRDNPCQHPIVILKDVKFQNLLDILKFMYNGEVSVATENFDSFLKTAELLQVSGLTEDDNRYSNEKENENVENTTPLVIEQLDRVSPSSRINEISKEKENSKKRMFENLSTIEESTSQKKRKDTELKVDIEIKQEEDDIANTEDSLEIKDPLEIGNETIETLNSIAQPELKRPKMESHNVVRVKYDLQLMERAILAVKNGNSIRNAARIYNVPKSTLARHYKKDVLQIGAGRKRVKYRAYVCGMKSKII